MGVGAGLGVGADAGALAGVVAGAELVTAGGFATWGAAAWWFTAGEMALRMALVSDGALRAVDGGAEGPVSSVLALVLGTVATGGAIVTTGAGVIDGGIDSGMVGVEDRAGAGVAVSEGDGTGAGWLAAEGAGGGTGRGDRAGDGREATFTAFGVAAALILTPLVESAAPSAASP
ncbi:MAG: hypothetical protein U0795_06065 [Pirellulales bacterium]